MSCCSFDSDREPPVVLVLGHSYISRLNQYIARDPKRENLSLEKSSVLSFMYDVGHDQPGSVFSAVIAARSRLESIPRRCGPRSRVQRPVRQCARLPNPPCFRLSILRFVLRAYPACVMYSFVVSYRVYSCRSGSRTTTRTWQDALTACSLNFWKVYRTCIFGAIAHLR